MANRKAAPVEPQPVGSSAVPPYTPDLRDLATVRVKGKPYKPSDSPHATPPGSNARVPRIEAEVAVLLDWATPVDPIEPSRQAAELAVAYLERQRNGMPEDTYFQTHPRRRAAYERVLAILERS